MKKILIVVCLFVLAGVAPAFAQQASEEYYTEEPLVETASSRKVIEASDMILGLWWSPEMDAQIEIYKEEGNKWHRKNLNQVLYLTMLT